MIEINLIPDVKRELLKAQRTRGVVISASIFISIVAVAVLVLLLVYVYGVQWARSAYLDGQITEKGKQLSQVEDLSQILTIQKQLSSISSLNDSKNMTSRVFDIVSAVTPPEPNGVSFSQITVSPSGSVGADDSDESATGAGTLYLEGQTSGYTSMEIFKKTVSNTIIHLVKDGETVEVPLASNISTGDISYGEDSGGAKVLRFSISFEYPQELLSPSSTGISFKLKQNGNVTDSYLGIPRFTTRATDINEGGQ